MTEHERLAAMTQILSELLGDDSIALTMGSVREDVPGWDSSAYINFIGAVEAEFGVKFRILQCLQHRSDSESPGDRVTSTKWFANQPNQKAAQYDHNQYQQARFRRHHVGRSSARC